MTAVSTSPQSLPPDPPETSDGALSMRRAALPGELAIIAVLVLCYDRIRDLAPTRRALSLHNGLELLGLERHLKINVELPVNLWLAAHHQMAELASWYYQLAHLTVTLVVLVVCYIRRPDVYRPARNALVLINVIALPVFLIYPVAPPRLLSGSAFIDVTRMTGVAAASNTSAPDPYAAMPSLHTAWAVWVTVVAILLVRTWWVRLLWVIYPLITVTVIVSTGNHYVVDALAGAAVALVSAATFGLIAGGPDGTRRLLGPPPRRRPATESAAVPAR
jgi:PAP2 superfamily